MMMMSTCTPHGYSSDSPSQEITVIIDFIIDLSFIIDYNLLFHLSFLLILSLIIIIFFSSLFLIDFIIDYH